MWPFITDDTCCQECGSTLISTGVKIVCSVLIEISGVTMSV